MSIINIDKIDSIGIDKLSNEVILTISDHLDWENEELHLKILQDKLNCYLEFIESGQIIEEYPNALNRKIIIEIISKVEYNDSGKSFLEKVIPILKSIDINIRQKTI